MLSCAHGRGCMSPIGLCHEAFIACDHSRCSGGSCFLPVLFLRMTLIIPARQARRLRHARSSNSLTSTVSRSMIYAALSHGVLDCRRFCEPLSSWVRAGIAAQHLSLRYRYSFHLTAREASASFYDICGEPDSSILSASNQTAASPSLNFHR